MWFLNFLHCYCWRDNTSANDDNDESYDSISAPSVTMNVNANIDTALLTQRIFSHLLSPTQHISSHLLSPLTHSTRAVCDRRGCGGVKESDLFHRVHSEESSSSCTRNDTTVSTSTRTSAVLILFMFVLSIALHILCRVMRFVVTVV